MTLQLVTGKDQKILRTVCDEVDDFDRSLKKLVKDMKKLMIRNKGLGLAAPQVNVNARVFLVTLGYGKDDAQVMTMVNPEIVFASDKTNIGEEGCLSLPGVFGNVERSQEVVVRFYDVKGAEHRLKLEDLDARIVQHELDHLNGVLFIDKLADAVVM